MVILNKALKLYTERTRLFSVGGMTNACPRCSARRFPKETIDSCCAGGKAWFKINKNIQVDLPQRQDIPVELQRLMLDPAFLRHIRKYNQGMAFTSTGVNVDQTLANANHGVYTYRIKGQLTHRIGSLLPQEGERPKFCQIFFMDDEEEQANIRQEVFQMPGSRANFRTLNDILRESSNPYVEIFRQAREIQASNLAIKIAQKTPDPRRYKAPSVSEVF